MKTFKQWTETWSVPTRQKWCRITVRTVIVTIFVPYLAFVIFRSIIQNAVAALQDIREAYDQLRFYWVGEYHPLVKEGHK